jgi:hypothetical protein
VSCDFFIADKTCCSFLTYIEVVENMKCIPKHKRPAVPNALSVQEYNSKTDL